MRMDKCKQEVDMTIREENLKELRSKAGEFLDEGGKENGGMKRTCALNWHINMRALGGKTPSS